jgi:hypothetical protein
MYAVKGTVGIYRNNIKNASWGVNLVCTRNFHKDSLIVCFIDILKLFGVLVLVSVGEEVTIKAGVKYVKCLIL